MRKIMRLANSRFCVCREHSNACNPRGGCAESELGRGGGRSSSVTDGLTWVVLGKGELVNSPDSRFKSCQQDKWRRKWQPTLVFLPGESQGQRSLVGVYGVAQSRTRLQRLSSSSSSRIRGVIKSMSWGTSWKEQEFRDKNSGLDFVTYMLWESHARAYEWVSASLKVSLW